MFNRYSFQALLASKDSPEQHLQRILTNTITITFLGTPHAGATIARAARVLLELIPSMRAPNKRILELFIPDSEVRADLDTQFPSMLRSRQDTGKRPIKIVCFYEELPLDIGKMVSRSL